MKGTEIVYMDLGTVSAHKSSVGKPHRQKTVLEIGIPTEQ
jgi:hypothetical protein